MSRTMYGPVPIGLRFGPSLDFAPFAFFEEVGGAESFRKLGPYLSLFVIDAGGHYLPVRGKIGQNIFGPLGLVNSDEHCAIPAGDVGEYGQLPRHGVTIGDPAVNQKDDASGDQGDAASEHDDQSHLASNG